MLCIIIKSESEACTVKWALDRISAAVILIKSFRIDGVVRQDFMSLWIFTVMEVKIGIGRMGIRFLEEGREWVLSSLLYAEDLVYTASSKIT